MIMARSHLVIVLLLLIGNVSHQAPLIQQQVDCSNINTSNCIKVVTTTTSTQGVLSPSLTVHHSTISPSPSLSSIASITPTATVTIQTTTTTSTTTSTSSTSLHKNNENTKTWKSCSEVAASSSTTKGPNTSGIYNIFFGPFTKTSAYCDTVNSTIGWTVILKRSAEGALLFNKTWEQYEFGFGSLAGEFWYGLDKISFLTSRGTWELLVQLKTDKNETLSAVYSDFRIHGPDKNYTLQAKSHSGVEDFLFQYNGRPFSTFDRSHVSEAFNCAKHLNSGWWYTDSCYEDKALILSESFGKRGLRWTVSSERKYHIKSIVMKVRQRLDQSLVTSPTPLATNR